MIEQFSIENVLGNEKFSFVADTNIIWKDLIDHEWLDWIQYLQSYIKMVNDSKNILYAIYSKYEVWWK